MLDFISFDGEPSWSLNRTFASKHEGVVRSTLLDIENNVLLTGGEDSKLNVWSCQFPPGGVGSGAESMDVDPPRKRGRTDDHEEDLKRSRMY